MWPFSILYLWQSYARGCLSALVTTSEFQRALNKRRRGMPSLRTPALRSHVSNLSLRPKQGKHDPLKWLQRNLRLVQRGSKDN